MDKIKLKTNAATILEAFEIMLADKKTVTLQEVREAAPTLGSRTNVTRLVGELMALGLLVRTTEFGNHNAAYSLPENFEELKPRLAMVKVQKGGRVRGKKYPLRRQPAPGRMSPSSLLVPAKPKEPEPKVNGFPYTPKEELRHHLGRLIEGLETIQAHIGPVLTLLLDLDRDYDRHTDVTKKLVDIKTQLGGLIA